MKDLNTMFHESDPRYHPLAEIKAKELEYNGYYIKSRKGSKEGMAKNKIKRRRKKKKAEKRSRRKNRKEKKAAANNA